MTKKYDKAREAIEGKEPKPEGKDKKRPTAGPHAKKSATNEEATPGTGALPATGKSESIEPGTG